LQDGIIADNARNIAGLTWTSEGGHQFDDKYKKLASVAAKHGCPHVQKHLEEIKAKSKGRIARKLVKGKNENPTIQNEKKTKSYKPLIFQSERLIQPKIPLSLITNVHKPNLYEKQNFTIFVEQPSG